MDSRVGLQKTDLELFELIGESGFAGDVIIVLTKVDKKSARAAEVLAAVRQNGAGGAGRLDVVQGGDWAGGALAGAPGCCRAGGGLVTGVRRLDYSGSVVDGVRRGPHAAAR